MLKIPSVSLARRQKRDARWGLFCGFCASVLLLGTGRAPAGEETASPQFLLRSWDNVSGLPAARVQAIAQTGDGYLWVGTGRGLARFDGVRFVNFTASNTPALGDARISCLLETRSGELWVGTERGALSRRRGSVFEAILTGAGRGARINSLTEDRDGALWIGTGGSGLARWFQGKCEWFNVEDTTNAAANDVTQVITDGQGRLWAVAGEKLAAFRGGAWRTMPPTTTLGQREVAALASARDGSVWASVCARQMLTRRGTELFRLEGNEWTNQLAPYPWGQRSIFTRTGRLMEDQLGRLWVATTGAGIYTWTAKDGWQPLVKSGNSSFGESSSLAEDKDGLVWIGTPDSQLVQLRNRPVNALPLPASARQNVVLTACARRDGSLWVGTDGGGAYYYDLNGVAKAEIDPDWHHLETHVGVLYEDRQTNLWAGTWVGLYRWEAGRFQRATNIPAPTNVVLTLFEDSRSNLWVGTGAGVLRSGPDGTRFYAQPEGIDHFYIRAIEEDRSGQIWVAITDRGLYRKSGERFEHYGAGRWCGEQRIRELHADAEGALWMTTDSKGLARLKDGKFREWTTDDGLPSDDLIAVTEDALGNLWVSSANGIFGCPKSRLLNYQRGLSPPIVFWQLSAEDGLETRRCSGAGQPVVAHSSDGRLWFPNWHAIAVFDPAQAHGIAAASPRPPLFEETLIDGMPSKPEVGDALRAKAASRSFEFHYTSPVLEAPDRVQFRYRLVGLDSRWVEAGPRRTAYYSQLPAGHYEFQVMASGAEGVWQESRQRLALEVAPQFWERRSVQVAAASILLAAALAAIYGGLRARLGRRLATLERQSALEQERTRIARDMHDEIGARLTQISFLSALADGSAGDEVEVRTQTRKITAMARGLTRSLDEIVWAVRPQNDNLESMVDYLDDSLRDLCDGSPVRYWFSGPAAVPSVEISASVRHNLLLACSEAVNNALKHSGASEVRVKARLEAQTLEIQIADNGCGFDVAKAESEGSGLVHIRQRLKEIGGQCALESSEKSGTRYMFSIRIMR